MRVIHIGKDIQPVNLPGMASVSSFSWGKSASFCTLHDTIYSLADFHSVADVISLVSNEISLDTGAAFQEAQSVAKYVIENSLSITNLEPLAFLTSSGKLVNIDGVSDQKSRPEDIAFFSFQ